MSVTSEPASTSSQPTASTPVALWIVVALFIAAASLFSLAVPPFETPDEIWHYAFIQHVAGGRGLPVSEPDTQAMWQQQGVQAPGYYMAAAALTWWIDQSDFPHVYSRTNPHGAIGEPDAQTNRNYLVHHRDDGWPWSGTILALHSARLFSILLGAVALWACYQAVAPILGSASALVGVAVFAFIPQFVFISAAASNDNAVNALAALVLWRLVLLIMRDPDIESDISLPRMRRDYMIVGMLLGLAALSKLSALGLVALTGLAVLHNAWSRRSIRPVLEAILWIGVPAALIAGWWYIRNYLLYDDVLAWNIWQENILLRVDTAAWGVITSELISLERSFWGLFGWLNIPYPEFVYWAFRILSLLIVIGMGLAFIRWLLYSRRTDSRWIAGGLLLMWLLILTVSWVRFMRIAPAAQGRYFFPAASTLAMLIGIGLTAFRIRALGWIVAALMCALTFLTPFWIITPAYMPPVQIATVDELQPATVCFGDAITLVGIDSRQEQLQPGGIAIVRAAWQSDSTPQRDYSVFVHLVDDLGLIIAQHDTMPGGGLAPTSQWTPGHLQVDEYRVVIPETAYTPNHASWRVGLYDAATGERLSVTQPGNDKYGSPVHALLDSVRFGEIAISPTLGSLPNPLAIRFQDNIELAGYAVNNRRLAPGQELAATLYWRPYGAIRGDYTAFVHLLDQERVMHGGFDDSFDPATSSWPIGEVVTDTHAFVVPESARPGVYQLEIGLYLQPDHDRLLLLDTSGAEGADRLLLGPFEVLAPE